MIIGLQITGFIFSLLMIYFAMVHYKKGSLNGMEMAVWFTIWILVILAVIFPEILRTYSETFAVSRLFDLLVVGGFIVVIFLVSSSYIRTKNTEKKIEEIIRKDALNKK